LCLLNNCPLYRKGCIMIDEYTRASVNIDYPHHQIHDGNSYFAEVINTEMSTDDTLMLMLVTADSNDWVHLIWGGNVTAEALVQFYEGVTYSSAGSAVTIVNRHRNSAATSATVAKKDPTITDYGTLLTTLFCGTTGLHLTESSNSRNENEWILKPNTKYLLKITAQGAMKGRLYGNWSEHTSLGFEGWM